MDPYTWLPEHQEHVVYSLAHADDLIARAGKILYAFTDAGTLRLDDVVVGTSVRITVTDVVPIPQAVPRLAADALNQLRAILEHVVYAEVEREVGRPLSPQEARSLEMPAATTMNDFDNWLKHRHRSRLAPLQAGALLHERLRDLQPLRRQDPELHPLRILVEHTNWSKHRTPPVAATHIGKVIPDRSAENVLVTTSPNRPVEIGDVLASRPNGSEIALDVWPEISIQRPHLGTWRNLIHELADLEIWVREVALPWLITGTTDVPSLPPHLDITVGYPNLHEALAAASSMSAATRATRDIQVAVARDGLIRMCMSHPDGTNKIDAITRWITALSADEILQTVESLPKSNPWQLHATVRSMIADAQKADE